MRDSALFAGVNGLDGILARIVEPLLDELSLRNSQYGPLLELIDNLCWALANKLQRYTKVQISSVMIFLKTCSQVQTLLGDWEKTCFSESPRSSEYIDMLPIPYCIHGNWLCRTITCQ